jgi:hypothetical protein
MRRTLIALCSAALFAFLVTPQAPVTLCSGFLPPNDMKIPVGSKSAKGMREDQFNKVLDSIQEVYGPIVEADGGVLEINRMWDDSTVNASTQRMGNRYILNMYGGLARHQAISQDGFTLVACHELGHQVGGAPIMAGEWASVEGQSDYYATLKCMRKVFSSAGSKSFSRKGTSDPVAEKACAASFKSASDKALCLRNAMAGMSVTSLFSTLGQEGALPRFDTPDPAVVSHTDEEHPATQCRLDTYFQGSICPVSASKNVSDKNAATGTCTKSQGHTVGLRSLCWYKPPASENKDLAAKFGNPMADVKASLDKSGAFVQLNGEGNIWQ